MAGPQTGSCSMELDLDLDLVQQLQEYVAERIQFLEKYGDPIGDEQELSRLLEWSDRLELATSPH